MIIEKPIPVSAEFSAAVLRMFPSANHREDWRVEDHGDGAGPMLVHWAISAPIPTSRDVSTAMLGAEWDGVRSKRDELLKASDFSQLDDVQKSMSVEARAAWAAYRIALRDITDTGTPETAIFPTAPVKD